MIARHGICPFTRARGKDMTSYEIYVFILCLIVFALLTTVFVSMLVIMVQQSLRLIDAGTEDQRIYEEYKKAEENKNAKTGWLSVVFTVFFACIIVAIFTFTLVVQLNKDKPTKEIPVLRAVYSDSMSAKYEKNEYLYKNNLNDQFNRFDIVVTYQLPAEEDLKLYDIVVYEVDNVLLIHRIVGIEEPNARHPNERYFVLQGDLVENPDKFPVRYSQMKAIYRGERVPFIGSLVIFLQSPAGYVCLFLVIAEMISSPIIAKKIEEAEKVRLALMLKKEEEQEALEEENALETQRKLEEKRAMATQAMIAAQSALTEQAIPDGQAVAAEEESAYALSGRKTVRIATVHYYKIKVKR